MQYLLTVKTALLVVFSAEPKARCPLLDAFTLWPPVMLQYEAFVRAVGTNTGVLGIDALAYVPFKRWYCKAA
jgi:hypothetical protein